MNESERAALLKLLRQHAGLRIHTALEPRLAHALSVAETELGISRETLLERAESGDQTALIPLIRASLVGESWFFRGREQLEFVAATLVPRARAARGRARVWSCCCSTGEEAWSLAALISAIPDARSSEVELLATDINEQALTHARLGVYRAWSVRDASPNEIARVVEPIDNRLRVRNELRSWVDFDTLNLVDLVEDAEHPALAEPWDAIVCRNALMYLDPELATRVIERLAGALHPEGALVLGATEPALPSHLRSWLRLDLGSNVLVRPAGGELAGAIGLDSLGGLESSDASLLVLPEPELEAPPSIVLPPSPRGRRGQARTDPSASSELASPPIAAHPSVPASAAEIDSVSGGVLPDGHSDHEILREALTLADRGEVASALELVDALIASHCPPRALTARAILLEAMGKRDDAHRAAQTALIVEPRSAEAAIVAARTVGPANGRKVMLRALARARRALVGRAPDSELPLMPGAPTRHLLSALEQLE